MCTEGGSATIELFSEIATLDPVKGTGSGGSDGQRFHALYGGLVVPGLLALVLIGVPHG